MQTVYRSGVSKPLSFAVDRNERSDGQNWHTVMNLVPSDFFEFSSLESKDKTKDTPQCRRAFCLTVPDKT